MLVCLEVYRQSSQKSSNHRGHKHGSPESCRQSLFACVSTIPHSSDPGKYLVLSRHVTHMCSTWVMVCVYESYHRSLRDLSTCSLSLDPGYLCKRTIHSYLLNTQSTGTAGEYPLGQWASIQQDSPGLEYSSHKYAPHTQSKFKLTLGASEHLVGPTESNISRVYNLHDHKERFISATMKSSSSGADINRTGRQ